MLSDRTLRSLVSLLAVGLLLTACDPEEQDRVLRYEKGSYLGQADEPVTPEVREQLRARARLQSGL